MLLLIKRVQISLFYNKFTFIRRFDTSVALNRTFLGFSCVSYCGPVRNYDNSIINRLIN